MIQKGIKNINLLFIWLTGLLFFAHGITPHHHHFDSVIEHNQQNSQAEQHSEDNPLHCHAFNVLVIDKTQVSVSNVSAANNFSVVIFNDGLHLRITENPFGKTNVVNQDDVPPEVAFEKNSPTRGSPALV